MEDFEYNPQEVEELVKEALEGGITPFDAKVRIPLGVGDSRLLETLCKILAKHVVQPDVQMILDELRDELYSDVSMDTLNQLHSITLACRRCPLVVPNPSVPIWNKVDPDLLIVTETPSIEQKGMDLLVESLSQAGFHSTRIGMTFVNRCKTGEFRHHDMNEINNCLGYLHSEIQIIRPKLILALGGVALSAIFGPGHKIGDIKGQVVWLGPWAVVGVYSPSYVIRSADHVKQAFDQDIQRCYDFVYGEK